MLLRVRSSLIAIYMAKANVKCGESKMRDALENAVRYIISVTVASHASPTSHVSPSAHGKPYIADRRTISEATTL